MSEIREDDDLLLAFLDESEESMGTIGQAFVELERTPEDKDIINSIFRPVHSMKGASGFFGLENIKKLSHHLENLLDDMRNGEVKANQQIFDVLYDGVDMLKVFMANVRANKPEVEDGSKLEELIVLIEKYRGEGVEEDEGAIVQKFTASLQMMKNLSEANQPVPLDEIKLLEDLFIKLHPEHFENDSVNSTLPSKEIHKILSEPFEGETATVERAQYVKSELNKLSDHFNNEESQRELEKIIVDYDAIVDSIGYDGLLQDIIKEGIDRIEAVEQWDENEVVEAVASEEPSPPKVESNDNVKEEAVVKENNVQAVNKKNQPKKTMRVPEESIDTFLSYVGELIIVQEMFNYIQKTLQSVPGLIGMSKNFQNINESFRSLSLNLQRSLMEIRKVPANAILQKGPRIIRDIARDTSKKMRVEIVGGDVAIDKSLVDTLDAPFTHMIRNAGDHGIEASEDMRLASGKDPEGLIIIEMKEDSERIHMSIKDDGAGLNLKAIRNKAEEIGLITPGSELTEDNIVDLIFSSGVSTAAEITDISGRGVGMDVVKRNIEASGGKISVNTKSGEGSTFTISLPKTVSTQIMEGFFILHQKECYVLPMDQVQESFSPEGVQLNTIGEGKETITRRGVIYPLIRLSEIFRDSSHRGNVEKGIFIMLEVNRSKFVLLVDEIEGTHQVVVKELKGVPQDGDLFLGAALRGDQSVAMILDTSRLTACAS